MKVTADIRDKVSRFLWGCANQDNTSPIVETDHQEELLLHQERQLSKDKTHVESIELVFQMYHLSRKWKKIRRVLHLGPPSPADLRDLAQAS